MRLISMLAGQADARRNSVGVGMCVAWLRLKPMEYAGSLMFCDVKRRNRIGYAAQTGRRRIAQSVDSVDFSPKMHGIGVWRSVTHGPKRATRRVTG